MGKRCLLHSHPAVYHTTSGPTEESAQRKRCIFTSWYAIGCILLFLAVAWLAWTPADAPQNSLTTLLTRAVTTHTSSGLHVRSRAAPTPITLSKKHGTISRAPGSIRSDHAQGHASFKNKALFRAHGSNIEFDAAIPEHGPTIATSATPTPTPFIVWVLPVLALFGGLASWQLLRPTRRWGWGSRKTFTDPLDVQGPGLDSIIFAGTNPAGARFAMMTMADADADADADTDADTDAADKGNEDEATSQMMDALGDLDAKGAGVNASMEKFWMAQRDIPLSSPAEEARTLAKLATMAVLKIRPNPKSAVLEMMVAVSVDALGGPILFLKPSQIAYSGFNETTPCSIRMMIGKDEHYQFTRGLLTLVGYLHKTKPERQADVGALYMDRFPAAEFNVGHILYRMEMPSTIELERGWQKIRIEPQDYIKASPDPICQDSKGLTKWLNDELASTVLAMARRTELWTAGGLMDIPEAKVLSVDRLGINIEAVCDNEPLKIRCPFPRPVEDSDDVKRVLLEITF